MAAFIVGSEPLEKGLRILGAHIDSPRLDLKEHPVYEAKGFALGDTHYYGGIKKYQFRSFSIKRSLMVIPFVCFLQYARLHANLQHLCRLKRHNL